MPSRGGRSNDNSLLWSMLGLCLAAAVVCWVSLLSEHEELRREKLDGERRERELKQQLEQSRRRQNKSVAVLVKELDLKTLDDRGLNFLSICLSQKWSAVTAEATRRAIAAAEKESTLCVVCLAQEKTHIFLPCGHRCTCEHCAGQVIRRTKLCPICRSQTQSIVKVFV